jgi:hypothetical protein
MERSVCPFNRTKDMATMLCLIFITKLNFLNIFGKLTGNVSKKKAVKNDDLPGGG